MKTVSQLLDQISHRLVQGDYSQMVSGVELDSRKVQNQCLFIAVRGKEADGHSFIRQAIKEGAIAIICEDPSVVSDPNVTIVEVKNSREVVGVLASNFFDHPSRKLKLIGVTGTNGKTSVVQLSHHLFMSLGAHSGMLSTIENKIGFDKLDASLTTPDAVSLQRLLAQMVASDCRYAFMEVSSHALDQHRTAGCKFDVAVFTNISHDHLDYHGSFNKYIAAKKSFFDRLESDAVALINIDDRRGEVMVQNSKAKVNHFALKKAATFKGKILDNSVDGLHLLIDDVELHAQLFGAFNASNLLATYAIARVMGHEKIDVLKQLSTLKPPRGRMEVVKDDRRRIVAFVDYAHTPDALENVLRTLNEIKRRNQQIITVVGCGGNRDHIKRPMMAEIAVRYSHQVILTSDNPRNEDPGEIIRQMETGVPKEQKSKVLSITDRRVAIRVASALSQEEGIVLVAGKGHETYQEVMGEYKPFDDREVLKSIFSSK